MADGGPFGDPAQGDPSDPEAGNQGFLKKVFVKTENFPFFYKKRRSIYVLYLILLVSLLLAFKFTDIIIKMIIAMIM